MRVCVCEDKSMSRSWIFSGLRFHPGVAVFFFFRAAKERKKPDRVVFECQERAYWVVHRPPVRAATSYLSSGSLIMYTLGASLV